jgi:hypothetical protein
MRRGFATRGGALAGVLSAAIWLIGRTIAAAAG